MGRRRNNKMSGVTKHAALRYCQQYMAEEWRALSKIKNAKKRKKARGALLKFAERILRGSYDWARAEGMSVGVMLTPEIVNANPKRKKIPQAQLRKMGLGKRGEFLTLVDGIAATVLDLSHKDTS